MAVVLRFRARDEGNFNQLKRGSKSIETRAATRKYKNIKVGDILVFACGSKKLRKKVLGVRKFRTISGMIKAMSFKKIMPWVSSVKEMEMEYYKFPGYKEKIKKFGLVALKLR